MKWENLGRSNNVEDLRGSGGGGLPVGAGGMSVGGLVLVLLASWIFGVNPLALLGLMDGPAQQAPVSQQGHAPPKTDQQAQFVEAVLGHMEKTWQDLLPSTFHPAKLALFSGRVQSACGYASSAVGPFYCPPDQRVYLDMSFFNELSQRFEAKSDFARAYVIAHEVGHHVQKLLGTSDYVQQQRAHSNKTQTNAMSVKLELQADCYAGVWGHYAEQQKLLEPGDLEGALTAASAIGDDNLQRRSQGYVVPESFTHGSSAQRVKWFRQGMSSGQPKACDTFSTANL
ncbi:MAG: neutral zinc metallopeptidase [Candidatus Sericytochromatia bacterium]